MKQRVYTLVILSGPDRTMIKVAIPASLVRKSLAAVAAALITLVVFGVTYGRMLMKVSDYNALRTERQVLENKYLSLTAEMEQTDEKLVSLRSLARDVALKLPAYPTATDEENKVPACEADPDTRDSACSGTPAGRLSLCL